MSASDQVRIMLLAAKKELDHERKQVEKLAMDVQSASEMIALRGEEVREILDGTSLNNNGYLLYGYLLQ